MIDRLMTRKEVSAHLQRSWYWIRQQEKKGLLPRVELSKRTIRYKESDVAKLVDRLTVGGHAL